MSSRSNLLNCRAPHLPQLCHMQDSGGKEFFLPLLKNVVKTTTSIPTTSSLATPANKSKGRETGLPMMDYEAEMQYDNEKGDSNWEDPATDTKAVDSHTAHQVWAILQSSLQIPHLGGSGSSEGRVPDIHPGTSAEF